MENVLSFFKSEPFTKEYTFNNFKVKLRTLTRAQFDDVMLRASISVDNIISKDAIVKRMILGYALVSINGVSVLEIPEIKEGIEDYKKRFNTQLVPTNLVIEDVLGKADAAYTDSLYDLYNLLKAENQERLEEIKKA